jgi:hypothetical protein
MPATYQIKKKAIGGYSVSYECPHCATALVSKLDEAGTSQPCPNCNAPFVVPGKTERDQLRARQEAEQRAKAASKLQIEQEKARQKQIAEAAARKEQAEEEALEQKRREYQDTHCPYCREEIRTSVKKCKHCHEYLDSDLRKTANKQDVVRFRPPLDDVFWLVVKFWAASILFGVACWLIVMLFLAVAGVGLNALR